MTVRRKTEILSFSVPPEMKKEFRRLQRHGTLSSGDRFGSEEELFGFLYGER